MILAYGTHEVNSMTDTRSDDIERATIVILLGWMTFSGSRRDEIFEWPIVDNQPQNRGWICS